MAGVNQVFSLADDVARYLRACGKRSILECKPLQGKINIEGLKYQPKLFNDVFCYNAPPLKTPETVLNLKTNSVEKITFSELPEVIKENYDYRISAYNIQGEKIGCAKIIPCVTNKGKETFWLDYIGTSNDYKGVGTEMIRKIVKESKRAGYHGNIDLSACTGSVPWEYQFNGFIEKCESCSAAIKYHKMGFRSYVKSYSEFIAEELRIGGNGLRKGKYGFVDILNSAPMYLSDEAIKKYLQ